MAPAWMQRGGLEWLFRLCQEPRRLLGRYLTTNTVFLTRLALALLRRWLHCPPASRGVAPAQSMCKSQADLGE
jgi:hypothetical protein